VVFAYSYYRGLLLGVVLVDARECEPPSFDVCLPCDACILGGFSRCFSGFFWLVLVFLGQVQQELSTYSIKLLSYTIITIYKLLSCILVSPLVPKVVLP
jgi:hypothetical protein